MVKTGDPRVDDYIAASAEFARPILRRLRSLVHAGCPQVEETLKWGHPSFVYKGILCGMAAFKNHCVFGFWKEDLILERTRSLDATGEPVGRRLGRITSVSDLPDEKTLLLHVRQAAALNDQGVKSPRKAKVRNPRELEVPDYFMNAVRRNRKALATFEGFSYSNRKEYVEWVTTAKSEETRKRRLETSVAWMAEGKVRNWKYMRK